MASKTVTIGGRRLLPVRRHDGGPLPGFDVLCEDPLLAASLPRLLATVKATSRYGYGKICRLLRRIYPERAAALRLDDGTIFAFQAWDSYWNYHFRKGFCYEEEIAVALSTFSEIDYVFLDCGANIGYWSTLVSSSTFGSRRCAAVEASAETFAELELNARINGDRFQVLHRAMYSTDDVELDFSGGLHAGRHIIEGGRGEEKVRSISLDSLIDTFGDPAPAHIAVKLDVEGAEAAVISGFSRSADIDWVFLYEDHGRDRAHEATKAMRDLLAPSIWFVDDDASIRRIDTDDQIDAIKTNRIRGYNFFACKPGGAFDAAFAAS